MSKCLNCNKPISKRNSKFCSNKCQRIYENSQWIERWKLGLETGLRGKYNISKTLRDYIFKKYNSRCARCGWTGYNPFTKRFPLEIEHIDGNFRNNSEDNLILLCPNCHSLTSTYKGANKGFGRKARKKYN